MGRQTRIRATFGNPRFVDNGKSVDWIKDTGCKVINLLVKGSEKHCRIQLRKTPEEHFKQVGENILYADQKGLGVNVYLEDWSNGMRDSFQYIHAFMTFLQDFPVERVMLPDTLGILNPEATTRYLDWMYLAFPNAKLDFHAHNDYGLATANSLAAAEAGISGIHTTVNGLGERAGNQSLAEAAAVVNDMSKRKTHLAEKQLQYAATLMQTISGKRTVQIHRLSVRMCTLKLVEYTPTATKRVIFTRINCSLNVSGANVFMRWANLAARLHSKKILMKWVWNLILLYIPKS